MVLTKYISLDEFKDYFGIDLIQELGSQESALSFLKRIEDRMETFVGANFDRNVDREYAKFTDYQKIHYKRALLEQAIYILKNSDISVDSGYDIDKGVVVDIETIKKLSISLNSKQELILCGLWSRHLRAGRYDIWDWFIR